MELLLYALCGLMLIVIAFIIYFRPRPNSNLFALSSSLDRLLHSLHNMEASLKNDLRHNREETAATARDNRAELNATLHQFKTEMTATLQAITAQGRHTAEATQKTLDDKITELVLRTDANSRLAREEAAKGSREFMAEQRLQLAAVKQTLTELQAATLAQLEKLTAKMEERLGAVNEQARADAHLMRQSLDASFKGFRDTFTQSVEAMNNLQREKFAQLEARQSDLVTKTSDQLERMRQTVDEKLQKTLNERLGQSFELVGKQLERVQQGLGEMQTLAQDVGGLKKVLSNVKMRGGFGEVQLQMLLENILAPDQYAANVATKKGSTERVEFAIKLPNPGADQAWIWLPVDAKFPRDAYELLQTAYEAGDAGAVEAAQKSLETAIRKMAKDICEKYIDPPHTTGFAVLFLPFEGIYAEVVRKASLLEELQRDCNIMVAGPATLWAYLHSLQMGFRTLAIQKRSSEVWTVLGQVKKEFDSFGGLLEKAQGNIQAGLNQLDNVVGVRTRAIQRRLKGVQTEEASVPAPGINGHGAALLSEEGE